MIYDYRCQVCRKNFEIICQVKDYDRFAPCPKCQSPGIRIWSCKIHFTGTKIENAEFNQGLGKITKSKNHRNELAKRMGCEEIGNEKPKVIHKHFDSYREEKRKKRWEQDD